MASGFDFFIPPNSTSNVVRSFQRDWGSHDEPSFYTYQRILLPEISEEDNFTLLDDPAQGINASVQATATPGPLPKGMTFSNEKLMGVIIYCVLFIFAASGNLAVFFTLFRSRHSGCRVSRFIMHLSLADLIVTLVMMPIEIGWHVTVSWEAGDAMCRVLMFFRAYGFYLSSFILIAISLDRYWAVARPASLTAAEKRSRYLLALAWSLSLVATVPQVGRSCVNYH